MLIKKYELPAGGEGTEQTPPGVFLDIETTGFHRDSTILYLIGCGYFEKNRFHVIQWFNDDAVSEEGILLSLQQFLKEKDSVIYTYNGNNFDIPYINRHCSFHDIPVFLDKISSVDFYKQLRPFQTPLGLSEGKQKNWETFLGIHREDKYSGKELIQVYKDYLKKKDGELLDCLLLHNLEDVRGMSRLLPLLSYDSMARGNFSFQKMSYIHCPQLPLPDCLSFDCLLSAPLPKSLSLSAFFGNEQQMGAAVHGQNQEFSIILPVCDGIRKYFYPDYGEYYYLPGEDRAIHKSVGKYVSGSHRQKATARNCYIKKEGIFLPLLPDSSRYGMATNRMRYMEKMTVYKENYGDSLSWLDIEELLSSHDERLLPFLTDWFRQILIHSPS